MAENNNFLDIGSKVVLKNNLIGVFIYVESNKKLGLDGKKKRVYLLIYQNDGKFVNAYLLGKFEVEFGLESYSFVKFINDSTIIKENISKKLLHEKDSIVEIKSTEVINLP